MNEDTTILSSHSPICDADAYVVREPDCYYLYLLHDPTNRMSHLETKRLKACWICNHKPAPKAFSEKLFGDGKHAKAPMMPAENVAHDPKGMELDADALSLVWLEDGASVALLQGDAILAVIPPWSGYKDFCGYSRYAKGMGRYAWELTGALDAMHERVQKARRIWEIFLPDAKTMERWMYAQAETQYGFIGGVEQAFGIANVYDQKVHDVPFPVKHLLSGTRDGVVYGMTAGVSLCAMPAAEMYTKDDPKHALRIELGFAALPSQRAICLTMYQNLSMYAAFPWMHLTFLAHGHTMPLPNLAGFAAVVFLDPRQISGMEVPPYRDFLDGGKINPLWVVPLTKEAYDFLVAHDISTLLTRAYDPKRLHVFDGREKFAVRGKR